MKFKSMALAATLCAPALAMAQDSVTIYGLLDIGLVYTKMPSSSLVEVSAGNLAPVYMGFRGTEDLGAGMKAGFDLEMGIGLDTGALGKFPNSAAVFNRKSDVWLESSMGRVVLGRQQNQAFVTLLETDPRGVSDYGSGLNGFTNNGGSTSVDNAVAYISPNMGGFTVRGQYIFGEVVNNTGASSGKLFGASYKNEALTVSGSYFSMADPTNKKNNTGTMLGAAYTVGKLKIKGFASRFQNDFAAAGVVGANNVNSNINYYGVGGSYQITPMLLADAAYYRNRNKTDPTKFDSDVYAAGLMYSLSKRTTLYAQYIVNRNSGTSMFFTNSGTSVPTFLPKGTTNVTTVGIRHSF